MVTLRDHRNPSENRLRRFARAGALAVALVVAFAVIAPQAWAAGEMSEARGTVKDHEGNPVQGAIIHFKNTNYDSTYKAKTNKKGRYYIQGLLWDRNGMWHITVEADGFVPTLMKVTSRTQSAVVAKFEVPLKPGDKPVDINLRPTGLGEIDFILTSDAVYAEQVESGEADAAAKAVLAEDAKNAGSQPGQQEDARAKALRLANAGELEASIEFFAKAVEDKAAEDAEFREGYAKVLYQLRRLDEAEAEARAVVALAPEALGGRKVVYTVQAARESWDDALATLEEIKGIAPDDVWALEQTAFVASRKGDGEAELAAMERVAEIAPDNAEAWARLGDLYANEGRSADSQTAFQKVVELDPENAYQTFFNIGALILQGKNLSSGETDRAIAALRRAIEIKGDYAPAHRQLANALLQKQDFAGARSSLERYLEVRPNAPDATQVQALLKALPAS